MTLGYSTQINGKPTNFVNKIWAGLVMARLVPAYEDVFQKWGRTGREVIGSTPKLHTIRKDKTGRWKAGNQIHNVIHNRTPNRFQFTPILHCESVQKIEIRNIFDDRNAVIIDGRELAENEIRVLAANDGFETVEDFWDYFVWQDFEGVIIHWTKLKY